MFAATARNRSWRQLKRHVSRALRALGRLRRVADAIDAADDHEHVRGHQLAPSDAIPLPPPRRGGHVRRDPADHAGHGPAVRCVRLWRQRHRSVGRWSGRRVRRRPRSPWRQDHREGSANEDVGLRVAFEGHHRWVKRSQAGGRERAVQPAATAAITAHPRVRHRLEGVWRILPNAPSGAD